MKKIVFLAAFTLVATVAILVLTLGDFLALTDIHNEYVSAAILERLNVDLSSELPDWTGTAGEWAMVQFSYLARSAFLVLNFITLALCVYYLRKLDRGGAEAR